MAHSVRFRGERLKPSTRYSLSRQSADYKLRDFLCGLDSYSRGQFQGVIPYTWHPQEIVDFCDELRRHALQYGRGRNGEKILLLCIRRKGQPGLLRLATFRGTVGEIIEAERVTGRVSTVVNELAKDVGDCEVFPVFVSVIQDTLDDDVQDLRDALRATYCPNEVLPPEASAAADNDPSELEAPLGSDDHPTDSWKEGLGETSEEVFEEGRAVQALGTRYERDLAARKACLDHYGYGCQACGINMEEVYGTLGTGYIHVHHLRELSATGQTETSPIDDLVPLCPNCHAMIHRSSPALDLKELKAILLRRQTG